jgi:four helix bundle protein
MNHLEFGLAMQRRTKGLALALVHLFQQLPHTEEARILGRQLLRAGTGVAANYRACCRAKSRPDFVAKLATTTEEADETVFWLELLEEAQVAPTTQTQPLRQEAEEILRMLRASLTTARRPHSLTH